MLRKGLPRAFPGLEEVKAESVKEGTQYRSRVFQVTHPLSLRCSLPVICAHTHTGNSDSCTGGPTPCEQSSWVVPGHQQRSPSTVPPGTHLYTLSTGHMTLPPSLTADKHIWFPYLLILPPIHSPPAATQWRYVCSLFSRLTSAEDEYAVAEVSLVTFAACA